MVGKIVGNCPHSSGQARSVPECAAKIRSAASALSPKVVQKYLRLNVEQFQFKHDMWMLIFQKRQFWLAIGLLLVGISFLVFPSYGAYCESDRANNYYCAAYSVAMTLGHVVESHNGAITALATIFIGLFTYTLKRSTDKMWGAGERQIKTARQIATIQARQMRASIREAARSADAASRNARAFMSAERAYLFIQINSETASDIVSKYGFWNKSVGMFEDDVDTPSVGYSFKNFGRTAAILKEFSNQLVFLPDFPNVSEYKIRESMPDELIVEPSGTSAILGCLLEATFTVGNAVDFQERKASFWFYGYVKFDDAFGREHEWRWRFRYRRGDSGFRLVYYREFPDETQS